MRRVGTVVGLWADAEHDTVLCRISLEGSLGEDLGRYLMDSPEDWGLSVGCIWGDFTDKGGVRHISRVERLVDVSFCRAATWTWRGSPPPRNRQTRVLRVLAA